MKKRAKRRNKFYTNYIFWNLRMENKRNHVNCFDYYNYCVIDFSAELVLIYWQAIIGVINQAKESSVKTTIAREKEAIAHAWNAKKAEKLGYADQIGREDLESQLLSDGEIVTVGYGDDDENKAYLVVFVETGNRYQVSKIGEITFLGAAEGTSQIVEGKAQPADKRR